MKKISLFTAALFCSAIAFSQIGAGNWMVGGKGKLGFSSYEIYPGEKQKETSFRLSPNLGYFPVDNWAIGMSLGLEFSKTKFMGEEDKYNELGLGIFSRYYFLPKTQKVNIFGEAGFNFGGAKYEDEDRTSFNRYNLGVSMACFINPHTAFELGFDYSSRKYEDDDERYNMFGLCGGFQIHLDPCSKKKLAKETIRPTF